MYGRYVKQSKLIHKLMNNKKKHNPMKKQKQHQNEKNKTYLKYCKPRAQHTPLTARTETDACQYNEN